MRSRRSRLSSRAIRTQIGPVMSANPAATTTTISTAFTVSLSPARRVTSTTMPMMTRLAPNSRRMMPSRPRAVAVSDDADLRVHSSRWLSLPCRQTRAAPSTASTAGTKKWLSEPVDDSTPIITLAATAPAAYWTHKGRL